MLLFGGNVIDITGKSANEAHIFCSVTTVEGIIRYFGQVVQAAEYHVEF